MIKKTISLALASLIVALAPGFGGYEAMAQSVAAGRTGTAGAVRVPSLPLSVIAVGHPLGLTPVQTIALPSAVRAAVSAVPATAPAALAVAQKTAAAVARHAELPAPASQDQFKRTFDGSGLSGAENAAQTVAAAASAAAPASGLTPSLPLAGRKLLVMGSKPSRPWLMGSVLDYAKRTGLEVYLVDTAENRALNALKNPDQAIDDAHFLQAEIDNHDPAVMEAVTAQIAAFAGKAGFTQEDRVRTYLNPIAELTGMVVDTLGVFGNGLAVIGAAHTKSTAREIFAADPELAIAFDIINQEAPKDAAEEASTIAKVRREFRRIASSGRSGSVVMKPIHGGGSALVVVNIDSEEKAVAAWKEINAGLQDVTRPDRKFDMLDQYPGIIMEYQFDGIEVDIETLRSAAGDDYIMLDNPPMDAPYAVEKGLTAPSQLPAAIQKEGFRIASKALDALGYKVGNAHVEAKYSVLDGRWYILEVNARMGGGPVKPLVESVTGANLIWEDLNAHFALPATKALSAASLVTGESRFIIPRFSGKIVSIEGLEEAARMPGIVMADWFKKAGDMIKTAPEDTFDYFGMINAVGKDYDEALSRVLAALHLVKFSIETKDGRLVTQTGADKHEKVDMQDLLAGGDGRVKKSQSVWAKLLAAIKALPTSFKNYLTGSGLLAMSSEGIGIVTSVYGIQQFGLAAGILSQAVNMILRIPGSLLSAKWVKKFDAKKIYMVTTLVQGLMFLSLPLGAWLFGPASAAFLVQYFVVQGVQGLIYGATRGMAENQIMPRLVGNDAKTLETAGFLNMAVSEIFALGTAFFLSPGLRSIFGSNVALGVFAGIMLSSLFFFRKIKFPDEKAAAAAKVEEKVEEAATGTADKLPIREYIPYVATSFLHFSFYGLFTGLFATSTYLNQFMADKATGLYDLGSLAIGLIAAIPALIATLSPVDASKPVKKNLLERFGLKTWFGVAVAVAAGYLWAGVGALVVPGLIAAALLGAMTTVNRTKSMSSYLSRLKPEHHARVAAALNSVSVLATLIPFGLLSASRLMGVDPIRMLFGVVAGVSAVLAAAWVLTRQPKGE